MLKEQTPYQLLAASASLSLTERITHKLSYSINAETAIAIRDPCADLPNFPFSAKTADSSSSKLKKQLIVVKAIMAEETKMQIVARQLV